MAERIRSMLSGSEPMKPHHLLLGRHALAAVQEYDSCRMKAVCQNVTLDSRNVPQLQFVKHIPSSRNSFFEKVSDSELELAESLFVHDASSDVSIAASRNCIEKLIAVGLTNLLSKAKLDAHQIEFAYTEYTPPDQYPEVGVESLKVYRKVAFVIVSLVYTEGSDSAWVHVAKRVRKEVKRSLSM